MNKSKLLIAFSIPFIALFTLLLMFNETSATATKPNSVSNNNTLLSAPNRISDGGYGQLQSMAPGVVLVGLKPDVTLNMKQLNVQPNNTPLSTAFSDIGVQSIEPVFANATGRLFSASSNIEIKLNRIYRLHLSPDVDVMQAIQELSANPSVAYAEPDYIAHIITSPSDPLYPGQWGLTQIDAPAAWDVITGTSDVSIAVIDSGLDVDHPDLVSQLWVNPGEIAGNGVDDDNNGYIDDIHGWNLVDNNDDLNDNTGHGTQVAGVIAATTNNSEGVAGMCWNCRLMVVKVTQSSGVANYSDIAAGVAYAAQKGADVINLSLGGYSDSATLRAAIEAASQTAVVVGGAGNDDSSTLFYPAAYDGYVLAVAGTTSSDTKVGTSNYGTWVDVSAPGEAITTTFDGGGYGAASGTSVAAPFVSGLAGLLRSQHPDWSTNMVRAHIVQTTNNIDNLNPGYTGQLGSGRINANNAATVTAQPLLSYQVHMVDGEPNGKPEPGSIVDLDVTLLNEWANATNVYASLSTSDPYVTMINATAFYGSIAAYASGMNGTSFRFNLSGSAPYAYDVPFTLNVTADRGYTANIPLTISTSPGIVYVHGTLTTQTWTNNQTYIIDNDAGIAVGETLTIQPGTVVQFEGHYSFSVAGILVVDGTETQPIRFTSNQSNPMAGDWGMINFLDSSVDATFDNEGGYVGGSILRYAIIEYGQGVTVDRASPFISHNIFAHLSGVGASFESFMGTNTDGMIVADNIFLGVSMSIWIGQGIGSASIARNEISDVSEGAGIYAGGQITVTANRVANSHTGLNISGSGGFVSGNLLTNNDHYGMQIEGSPIVISNTVMFNGDVGIYIIGSDLPILYHNNLVANLGHYALYNNTASTIDATRNWWGVTDEAAIQATIYDGNDEFGLGVVDYGGYLSIPTQDAPAYVHDITIQPDTTLGIETATFDVQFSRLMDEKPDLMFWTTRRDTWQRFNKSNSGLTNDDVRAFLIDKNGDRWFGLWGSDSVVVWRTDGTWQVVLSNASVYGLTLGVDGNTVWVATNGGGTYSFSLNGTLLYHYPTPQQVMDVFVDSQDNKWIASWGQGLYLLQANGTWTHYTSSNSGLDSDTTYTLAKDNNGNMWCGFGDAGNIGVSKLKPDGTWETYTEWNSDLASNYVRTIAVDETGDVWFGTSGGLSVLRSNGTWDNYAIYDGNTIAFINNEVWVGEHRGVAILRNGMVERIPGVAPGIAGLPNDTVHDIVLDYDGSIWFATCCSNDPSGAAAVLWHGWDYEINGGVWVADNIWRVTYDITSLIPRDTYTVSVSGAKGTDGMTIPTDTRSTFTVDYAGEITDQTPPSAPWVIAGGKEGDASTITAMWLASDSDSSITGYRYAIGSAAGATDIVNWTDTSNSFVTKSGLGLVEGRQYWLAVQARNEGGLWSTSGYSAFVAGQPFHKVLLPVVLKN